MHREKQYSSAYRPLTTDTKEKLRVSILQVISDVILEGRKKTAPSMKFIEQTVSEDIRRLVAKMDDGLLHRHIYKDYIVVYFGTRGQQSFIVHKLTTESIVDLKDLIIQHKPGWALRAQAFPIAYKIADDDCFPLEMVWPRIEDYKERSRDSIRLTASRSGVRGRPRKNVPSKT